MYEDGIPANKVNNRNNKFAFWNGGADKGSTLTILPVTSNLTTSVTTVDFQPTAAATTYDLAGRRVAQNTRGVLVQKGKVVGSLIPKVLSRRTCAHSFPKRAATSLWLPASFVC